MAAPFVRVTWVWCQSARCRGFLHSPTWTNDHCYHLIRKYHSQAYAALWLMFPLGNTNWPIILGKSKEMWAFNVVLFSWQALVGKFPFERICKLSRYHPVAHMGVYFPQIGTFGVSYLATAHTKGQPVSEHTRESSSLFLSPSPV